MIRDTPALLLTLPFVLAAAAATHAADPSISSALPPVNPLEARITNGIVTAKLYLPSVDKGYYRSTRFDWSGAIYSLTYKGHEYYGPWYDKIDPTVINWVHRDGLVVSGPCSALMGPANEFQKPLGFDDARTGGTFIKIGVGVLRKDDGPYNSYKPYPVLNSGKWTIRKSRNQIVFTQELSDPDSGYGYIYRKTVRLEKGKPELTIEHSLKNTGKLVIDSNVYNHNFVVLDHQAPGPDFIFRVPFSIHIAPPAPGRPPRVNNFTVVRDNQVVYLKPLSGTDEAVVQIQGYGDSAKDNEVVMENKKVGAGLKISNDRPISRSCGSAWKRTSGRGKPYSARKVVPMYSVRNSPRRCSSGTTSVTNTSSMRGSTGGIRLKPSAASSLNQASIRSAICSGEPAVTK